MREDKFRMRYGAPAVLAGWFVTFILFCLGLTIVEKIFSGDGSTTFFLFLIFGFPVAAIIALPLALLVAWPLRRLRNQWLHVLLLGLAMGVAAAAILFTLSYPEVMEDGGSPASLLLVAAGVAVCTAIGRASVMKLVSRRNEGFHGLDSDRIAAINSHL